MSNSYFKFKKFTIQQDRCAMKVTTDACLFGAWCSREIKNSGLPIKKILDIGAGTGLLSLMTAQQNEVFIDAVEIDEAAAKQAAQNFEASPWNKSLSIHTFNILNFRADKKYDCIICNPPFYEKELASTNTKRNTAHHGYELNLRQLMNSINKHLAVKGIFFLLLPYKRAGEIPVLLQTEGLFTTKQCRVAPSVHHKSSRIMLMGGNRKAASQRCDIAIKNKEGAYTTEFIDLLKEYYLNL